MICFNSRINIPAAYEAKKTRDQPVIAILHIKFKSGYKRSQHHYCSHKNIMLPLLFHANNLCAAYRPIHLAEGFPPLL